MNLKPIATTTGAPLVLASGSPRRRKILAEHGVAFSVVKTDAEEISIPLEPERTVVENAAAKLAAARRQVGDVAAVLAADTIVWFDGRIFGKPRDLAEAADFLRTLGGQTHVVFTGVAFAPAGGEVRTVCVRSGVTLKKLDETTIAEYLARENPVDRAGAYDIDASGDLIVDSYAGSYENVMGLPLAPLKAFGIIADA